MALITNRAVEYPWDRDSDTDPIDRECNVKDENNWKEECEKALNNFSYNGDYYQSSFSIKKSNLENTINDWQGRFPELHEDLESWRISVGNRFTRREMLSPLRRGKKLICVFLKVYDKGEEEDTLRCVCIHGNISIRVKVLSLKDKFLGLVGYISGSDEPYIRMIKSHPKIMAALIMSRDSGLRVIWSN